MLQLRIRNFLIAIDQLLYVLLTLGGGMPDETISAALWRWERAGKIYGRLFRPLVDLLFSPFENNHCYRSFVSEQLRRHLPREYHLDHDC